MTIGRVTGLIIDITRNSIVKVYKQSLSCSSIQGVPSFWYKKMHTLLPWISYPVIILRFLFILAQSRILNGEYGKVKSNCLVSSVSHVLGLVVWRKFCHTYYPIFAKKLVVNDSHLCIYTGSKQYKKNT